MTEPIDPSRRRFLQGLGLAAGALASGALRPDKALAKVGKVGLPPVKVVVDGEDNRVGHMIRDGHAFAIPAPSRSVDVVIVGAGVSGLTAAYVLRDADLLILEKEARPGGHARKGSWRDVTYGVGAAYVEDTSGYTGTLIDELRIPLVKIADPGDALWAGGRAVPDFLGAGADRLPYGVKSRRAFKAFVEDMAKMKDLPPLPVEDATSAQLRWDGVSFGQHVRKAYGADVHRFVDLYCRSALGGSADEVSAYWGLCFLAGEGGDRYTAPGGNAAYGEALYKAVGPARVTTSATVIRVEPKGDGAWVSYVVGEEVTTVAAKAVIMTSPKHVTRRVVAGLPTDQDAAMGAVRYEPYVVANVLVEGAVPRPAFDTWVDGSPFADVVVADWTNPDKARRHGVLTTYCPVAHADRWRLLDDAWVVDHGRRVVAHLDRMHPGVARRVVEVRSFRWGHPMVTSSVGALTKLRPKVVRPFGAIRFAGSDSQMTATIEAAVWEGRANAQAVQAKLLGKR